jgi:uncharacterized protein YjbJ (UPF0337 family)
MDWNRIEGNWKQFKGSVKEQWGRLSDAQLDVIAGRREHLAIQIQEAYGITKKEAGKQLYDWQKVLKDVAVARS